MSEAAAPVVIVEKHSRFGGSVIERVIVCPGSPTMCDLVPKAPESEYAAEGTFAHAVGAHCLREGERSADNLIGSNLPYEVRADAWLAGQGAVIGRTITKEIATAVNIYLDTVYAELDASPDAELYVEEGFIIDVPSAEYGEVFGKNDSLIYSPSRRRLVVFDYKHGVGAHVVVLGNLQPIHYLTGAALNHPEWALEEIEAVIVQPRDWRNDRADDEDQWQGVRRCPVPPLALLDFVSTVDAAVRAANDAAVTILLGGPDVLTVLHPSTEPDGHCHFCDAAATCPALEAARTAHLPATIPDVEDLGVAVLPDPKNIDLDRLSRILTVTPLIKEWLKQVEDYATGLVRQNIQVPGFKLVETQGRRKWIAAETEIAAYLILVHGIPEPVVIPPRLITITEAEKLLRAQIGEPKEFKKAKDDLSLRYTLRSSSGHTLAPSSDKRDGVNLASNAVAGLADMTTT